MGEEVKEPRRTIPRAVVVALAITVLVYALVGVTLLASLGADRLAGSSGPLADAVEVAGAGWAGGLVRVGAAAAGLGALLALIAGVGRTMLAMGREGDLPGWLAAVHPRHRVPHHAEVAVAAVVVALVLVVDLRSAIGFYSFGVLLYYLVANVSAVTQEDEQRRYPRALQVLGSVGCLVLVATLPLASVVVGIAVFAVGLGYRLLGLRRSRAVHAVRAGRSTQVRIVAQNRQRITVPTGASTTRSAQGRRQAGHWCARARFAGRVPGEVELTRRMLPVRAAVTQSTKSRHRRDLGPGKSQPSPASSPPEDNAVRAGSAKSVKRHKNRQRWFTFG
jgi:amino acid transporter